METGNYKASFTYKLVDAVNYLILIVFIAIIILPFMNILALSFNDGKDATLGGIAFWPRAFSLANYYEVFSNPDIVQGFKISVFRTVLGTFLALFLTSMAAFALKKRSLPGVNFFMMMIVFTMLFSGGIVPYYMVLRSLGLTNTVWVFIIPSLYSAWNIILMRTFFSRIDVSLEESAKMDGANDFHIFFRIILPISTPVLAVIALFNGVHHWNDWFSGFFYTTNKDLWPLQTFLKRMLDQAEAIRQNMMLSYDPNDSRLSVTGESLKMATIVVAVFPIACVYPFLQKYFVKGIMIGSVKG